MSGWDKWGSKPKDESNIDDHIADEDINRLVPGSKPKPAPVSSGYGSSGYGYGAGRRDLLDDGYEDPLGHGPGYYNDRRTGPSSYRGGSNYQRTLDNQRGRDMPDIPASMDRRTNVAPYQPQTPVGKMAALKDEILSDGSIEHDVADDMISIMRAEVGKMLEAAGIIWKTQSVHDTTAFLRQLIGASMFKGDGGLVDITIQPDPKAKGKTTEA